MRRSSLGPRGAIPTARPARAASARQETARRARGERGPSNQKSTRQVRPRHCGVSAQRWTRALCRLPRAGDRRVRKDARLRSGLVPAATSWVPKRAVRCARAPARDLRDDPHPRRDWPAPRSPSTSVRRERDRVLATGTRSARGRARVPCPARSLHSQCPPSPSGPSFHRSPRRGPARRALNRPSAAPPRSATNAPEMPGTPRAIRLARLASATRATPLAFARQCRPLRLGYSRWA